MYAASKHAVTILTEGLRRELVEQNSNIRVTVSIQTAVSYACDAEGVREQGAKELKCDLRKLLND
jgi:short-subunit dehydrogenase